MIGPVNAKMPFTISLFFIYLKKSERIPMTHATIMIKWKDNKSKFIVFEVPGTKKCVILLDTITQPIKVNKNRTVPITSSIK